VLVAEDCFPSLHFLLSGLQKRLNFTLETVPIRPGEFWTRDEDFLDRWQDDVGLALLTWVSSTTSKRADLDTLVAHGNRLGTIVAIDVTQGVGICPFGVGTADAVVGSSLKWLCGFSGAGILYVRPQLLSECRPELRGWFSQPNPFSWDLNAFGYSEDSRRFDHGTPAVLAALASLPGLEYVLSEGVDKLARDNIVLTDYIVERSKAMNLKLVSPTEVGNRGGSIMLQAETPDAASQIQNQLKHNGYLCDNRGRTLRFSPGMVTMRKDVDGLCDFLTDLCPR